MNFFFKLVDYSDKYSIYFSNPKTWVMWAIIDLHDYLMFFLINVFIVVIVFLIYYLIYRYKFLHIASKDLPDYVEFKLEDVNHAPYLEFFWTMVPIVLLFLMGWPSFRVLYAMEQLIDPFHTIIIIGNQWYWTYQYSDFDVTFDMIFQLDSDLFIEYKKNAVNSVSTDSYLIKAAGIKHYVNFTQFIQLIGKHFRNYEESQIIYDSVIIPEENLPLGYPRMLSVDQVLILPCNISIRLLVTSADVIHSWALPSHGIKMDAIPGRINQIPFLCNFWGTYWGQCSELCGINHGFMPIEVMVVPFKDYMVYLNLNLAYRYEKFQPLLIKFFFAYVNHLKYVAEKDLYQQFSDVILNVENFKNVNNFFNEDFNEYNKKVIISDLESNNLPKESHQLSDLKKIFIYRPIKIKSEILKHMNFLMEKAPKNFLVNKNNEK